MTKCFRCGTRMGFNQSKGTDNEYQPPLNFFKFEGEDICSSCYAGNIQQEERLREEIYKKQHEETLKALGFAERKKRMKGEIK